MQQRYFKSEQPKNDKQQHQYPTRSKLSRKIKATQLKDEDEEKSFVHLREDGEKDLPVWTQHGIILCNEFGEPRLYPEGYPFHVIGLPPEDILSRVFLIKPDKRSNVKRALMIELIMMFYVSIKNCVWRWQQWVWKHYDV